MNNTTMSESAFKVLGYACRPEGAASYLFDKELAFLVRHGLIQLQNEYRYYATDEGKRIWLLG